MGALGLLVSEEGPVHQAKCPAQNKRKSPQPSGPRAGGDSGDPWISLCGENCTEGGFEVEDSEDQQPGERAGKKTLSRF